MNIKDSISLVVLTENKETCICLGCKTGIIVETFFKVFGKHNGVFGPGGHTPSWIESKYHCSSCGALFVPTKVNRFDLSHTVREKQVEDVLKNTRPVCLVKDLDKDVFTKNKRSYPPIVKGLDRFKKETLFRLIVSDKYGPDLYIVPEEGKPSKVVLWEEYSWVSRKLTKQEKKARQTKASGKIVSKSDKILSSLIDQTNIPEQKKNDPLPKGSVKAVCIVFSDPYFGEQQFLIPETALEFL